MKSLIGKVAICQHGIVALITGQQKRADDTYLYSGVILEGDVGSLNWQSIRPEVIGTIDDWVASRYNDLFGFTEANRP